MTKMRPQISSTAVLLAMFLSISAPGQAQSDTGRPLFESDSVLDVSIEAPLTTLMKERPDEEYLTGRFSFTGSDGVARDFDLKLRTRGKFRRQRSTCKFAPIMLNFQTKQLEGSIFEGQDKLKLITHCDTKKSRFEQLVLREYLTYRIHRILTDRSFGARLMRVTYVDTEGDEPFTRYGFVIEDEDDIGARLGLEKVDASSLRYSALDPAHTNLVTMYEFLIGNTDFSLVRGPEENDCCHNAIPFSDGNTIYSIPYDFDHAGLVDAPYAKPNPQFKTRSVKTRVYRGLCPHNEILPATLDYINGKSAEIEALVANLEGLDDKNRKQVADYLADFFETITEPRQIDRELVKKCL